MIENIKQFVNEHQTLIAVIITVLVICFLYRWFCCKDRPLAKKIKGGCPALIQAKDNLEELSLIKGRSKKIACIQTQDKLNFPNVGPSIFLIKFVKNFADFIINDDNFYLNVKQIEGKNYPPRIEGINCLHALLMIDESDFGKIDLLVLRNWFDLLVTKTSIFHQMNGIGQIYQSVEGSSFGVKITSIYASTVNLTPISDNSEYSINSQNIRFGSCGINNSYRDSWMKRADWRTISYIGNEYYTVKRPATGYQKADVFPACLIIPLVLGCFIPCCSDMFWKKVEKNSTYTDDELWIWWLGKMQLLM